MDELKVIKVGGKVIEDETKLSSFLDAVAELKEPVVLVHGGGKLASEMSKRLGISSEMHEGRRITDSQTLEVVTMVYGGLVNKKIVSALQAREVNAVGLTGADLNIIESEKRPVETINYGWVGDVKKVNPFWLIQLLENGVVPVLAPLTHDGNGHLLNTNADTIASVSAVALCEHFETELMLCFEQEGVMYKSQRIQVLNPEKYREFKAPGMISGGMIPKIDVGMMALEQGVSSVSIRSYQEIGKIKAGTELRLL